MNNIVIECYSTIFMRIYIAQKLSVIVNIT